MREVTTVRTRWKPKKVAEPLPHELFDNPNAYMTCNELTQLLGVSDRTVRRWVALERIPFVRINGWTIRFSKSEVAAWLQQRGA